jgi:hypothetical protein
LDPVEAEVAVARLAAFGISATPFPEVVDEHSSATRYYALWRACELPTTIPWKPASLGGTYDKAELDFFEAKVQFALEYGQLGSPDIFVLLDHAPVASDFYDVTDSIAS